MVMADWVKWVYEELSGQGLPSPLDEEIREEIRKALYAAGRVGVRYLVLDPKWKRVEVEWFIKRLRKKIIIPVWARRRNEILDKIHPACPWLNQRPRQSAKSWKDPNNYQLAISPPRTQNRQCGPRFKPRSVRANLLSLKQR
jgi:predicted GNAT family acetyltransferase